MRKRPLFTGALFLAFLIWIFTGVFSFAPYPENNAAEKRGVLSGEVCRMEEKTERVYLFLSDTQFVCSGVQTKHRGKVLLVLKKEACEIEKLRIGNRISAAAECCGFSSARNPGNFDEAEYYRSLGVFEKFELKGALTITDARVRVLRGFLEDVRKRLLSSIRKVADGETAGIFEAIVTGEKSGLDRETKEQYRKSGIAHILAISGLHISMLGMALLSLLRRRIPLLPAAILSGAVMLCFCIMSGGSASAVRATIMFLLRLLALFFGKRFDLLSALSLAGILLLLSNPFCLYNSGFQLSFGAILGIALLTPAFERLCESSKTEASPTWKQIAAMQEEAGAVRRFIKKLRPAFLASLSVTLFTLPVIINAYYQLPLFSLLLNLLVVPLMGLVLQGGVAGALAGLLSLFFGRMLIGLSVYLLNLIGFLCGLLDRIPFSVLICGHMSRVRCALYYAALILFLLLAAKRSGCRFSSGVHRSGSFGTFLHSNPALPALSTRRTFRRGHLSMLLLGSVLALLIFAKPSRTDLSLLFLDVDQGDCILIESPSGLNYMIDGGSSSVTDVYRYRLQGALKYRGISHLDHIMITHPDLDHISGILSLLEEEGAGSISAGEILIPEVKENENYDELLRKAEAAGVSVTSLHTGMRIRDGKITFRCLHPDADYRPADANGYSAVMELSYGAYRALFTGDIGEAEERILVAEGRLSSCNLLKVAHHGSRFSSTAEFLKKVQPEAAVVSAGIDNRYGHPHPDVLSRLAAVKADVYTTQENGAVAVTAFKDGTGRIRKTLSGP